MPAKTDQVYEIGRPSTLEITAMDVARMTRPERENRVRRLMWESHWIFQLAVDQLIVEPGKDYLGTALLFSGGNDSTTLAHLFRELADMAIHANTGVGVEETRQFVRDTCKAWDLPLDERHAPTTYRELVLEQGFPGPGQHFKMFQRLKERAILAARADLVTNSRQERVVYLAGRRKDESARRSNIPLWEREGSLIWVSPIALWTKLDLMTYRLMHPEIPHNRVSDLIHMSGECLCGAFAKKDEKEEIEFWFPGTVAEIRKLEAEVAAKNDRHRSATLADARHLLRMAPALRDDRAAHARQLDLVAERRRQAQVPLIPTERTRWGWGAYREDRKKLAAQNPTGSLCTSCTIEDPKVIAVAA